MLSILVKDDHLAWKKNGINQMTEYRFWYQRIDFKFFIDLRKILQSHEESISSNWYYSLFRIEFAKINVVELEKEISTFFSSKKKNRNCPLLIKPKQKPLKKSLIRFLVFQKDEIIWIACTSLFHKKKAKNIWSKWDVHCLNWFFFCYVYEFHWYDSGIVLSPL